MAPVEAATLVLNAAYLKIVLANGQMVLKRDLLTLHER
jgi:hypothetical protein